MQTHTVTGDSQYLPSSDIGCFYFSFLSFPSSGVRIAICGLTQYTVIVGVTIAYMITSSISLGAIEKSNCYHKNGHSVTCGASTNTYMISFGVAKIFLSQIPNIYKLLWLSTVAAVMSFCYSLIGVALSVAKIISGSIGETSLGGVPIDQHFTKAEKVWNILTSLGNIALAYTFSLILVEIQDTLSPPTNKVMKKANVMGVSVTSIFYLLCGCLGYAAFGNGAPGNILTGFGFYEPFWLIDLANACMVVHLLGAMQVISQPLFAAVETWAATKWKNSNFITGEHTRFRINLFRLVWRTFYIGATLLLAMAIPFFNTILGTCRINCLLALNCLFPYRDVYIYETMKTTQRFSLRWFGLQFINLSCLLVALAAASGSIQGIAKVL